MSIYERDTELSLLFIQSKYFTEVDKCLNDPCGDHGICIDGDTSSCNCTDGYTGEFCTSMYKLSFKYDIHIQNR